MIDFVIEKGKVQIDAYTLTIQEFNQIWDHDKSPSRDNASNMLTYVFHMCDIRDKNILKDIPVEIRDSHAKRNAFGSSTHEFTSKELKLIESAMAAYKRYNKNAIERFKYAIDMKLNEATEWLEDPANRISTRDDFEGQMDIIAKFDKILKTKEATDKYVREEQAKVKTQNNAKRSALSSGAIK